MPKKIATPKSVNILGVKYKIEFKTMEYGIAGCCDWRAKVISLDNAYKTDQKGYITTLVHEIGHAIFEEAALHQTSIHPDVEEIIVEQFSRIIFAAFFEAR